MANWRVRLASATSAVEVRFDRVRVRVRLRLGWLDPIRVILYRGYGTTETRFLRGRVVSRKVVRRATDSDSTWRNIRGMYRRFAGEEIPGARVLVRFTDSGGEDGGSTDGGGTDGEDAPTEAVTDSEGFFVVAQPLASAETGWREVRVDLVAPLVRGQAMGQATGQVLIPPPTAEFAVISDIDDTIVQTGATSLLTMARIVLLGNAHTRLPFQGVAAFYAALGDGASGQAQNPLFYVSSGPWNLYDLLLEFMEINRIPVGPLFLQDWGLGPRQLFKASHREHKRGVITTLLRDYPALPFVLIGDSGEMDPTIYSELAREFPGRIRAIYIRDARLEARAAAVRALAEEFHAGSTPLILASDTVAAAEHAAAHGLIAPDAVAAVRDDRERDQPIRPLAAWRRAVQLVRDRVGDAVRRRTS